MSKGQPPVRQIKIKNEGAEGWTTIGSIWPTAQSEIFSCRLRVDGREISAIIVPYEPKEPTPIDQAQQPATAAKPEPVRSAPRSRRQQGEQPRGAA